MFMDNVDHRYYKTWKAANARANKLKHLSKSGKAPTLRNPPKDKWIKVKAVKFLKNGGVAMKV